jgi:hypothetical protein
VSPVRLGNVAAPQAIMAPGRRRSQRSAAGDRNDDRAWGSWGLDPK